MWGEKDSPYISGVRVSNQNGKWYEWDKDDDEGEDRAI